MHILSHFTEQSANHVFPLEIVRAVVPNQSCIAYFRDLYLNAYHSFCLKLSEYFSSYFAKRSFVASRSEFKHTPRPVARLPGMKRNMQWRSIPRCSWSPRVIEMTNNFRERTPRDDCFFARKFTKITNGGRNMHRCCGMKSAIVYGPICSAAQGWGYWFIVVTIIGRIRGNSPACHFDLYIRSVLPGVPTNLTVEQLGVTS